MEAIELIFSNYTMDVIFKLLLSAVLCGIIGIERSSMSKPAGFGTHAIIGVSATLVVIASEYMALQYNGVDASRIPSQILAGIGFIGAGTIIRNGLNVRGVTTAAGILSVTCIGITVGMGFFLPAVVTTIIVVLILVVNHSVTGKVERIETINLSIRTANVDKAMDDMESVFKKEGIVIESIKKDSDIITNKRENVIKVTITYDHKKIAQNEIVSKLVSFSSIKEVESDE